MTVWLAIVITVFAVALSVGLMYLVRRLAPPGGLPAEGSRSAAVFGVLGTSFAVLLAFVMFLSFQSYVTAKQAATVEALSVHEMYRGASLFDDATAEDLRGELICYARSVIGDEWRTMQAQQTSPRVERWIAMIEQKVDSAAIQGWKQSTRFSHWLDESAERREGRRGRLAEAAPFVPGLLWLVCWSAPACSW